MRQLRAAQPGHAIVRDDDVVNFRIEQRQCLLSIAGTINGIAEVGQEPLGRDAGRVAVIHQEYGLQRSRVMSFHTIQVVGL